MNSQYITYSSLASLNLLTHDCKYYFLSAVMAIPSAIRILLYYLFYHQLFLRLQIFQVKLSRKCHTVQSFNCTISIQKPNCSIPIFVRIWFCIILSNIVIVICEHSSLELSTESHSTYSRKLFLEQLLKIDLCRSQLCVFHLEALQVLLGISSGPRTFRVFICWTTF